MHAGYAMESAHPAVFFLFFFYLFLPLNERTTRARNCYKGFYVNVTHSSTINMD